MKAALEKLLTFLLTKQSYRDKAVQLFVFFRCSSVVLNNAFKKYVNPYLTLFEFSS